MPERSLWPPLLLSALLLGLQAPAHAQAPADAAARGLARVQQTLRQAAQTLHRAERAHDEARTQARDAVLVLASVDAKRSDLVRSAVQRVSDGNERLRQADEQLRAAQDAMREASQRLTTVALDYERCNGGATCLASQVGPDGAGPVMTASDYAATTQLMAQAQKAQELAAGIKKRAESGFPIGDGAVVAGLKMAEEARVQGQGDGGQTALKKAKDAFEKAGEVSRQARGVQTQANDVVQTTLALAPCRQDQPCDGLRSHSTEAALRDMQALQALDEGTKKLAQQGRLSAYWVDERLAGIKDEADRDAAVEFLAFVDKNPDAKALFGGESIRLSAAKGAQATVRLFAQHRFSPWFTRDHTLTLETPAPEKGPAKLYSTVDGLASATTLSWGYTVARAKTREQRFFGRLYQFGVSGKLGYESFDYQDPAQVGTALTAARTPKSVSAHLLIAGTARKETHQYSVAMQRAYGLPDATIQCPLTPPADAKSLTCEQAAFGPPKAKNGWLWGYEYRRLADDYGIAPKLSYNHAEDAKKRAAEFALPVYLLQDFSDDKAPFTGGLQFKWTRPVGSASTVKPQTEVSVFITAPLKLR